MQDAWQSLTLDDVQLDRIEENERGLPNIAEEKICRRMEISME